MPYRVVAITGRLVPTRKRLAPVQVNAVGLTYRAFTQSTLSAGLTFKVVVRANAEVRPQVTYLEFPADDRLSLVNLADPSDVYAFDVICPGTEGRVSVGPFSTPRLPPLSREASVQIPEVSVG